MKNSKPKIEKSIFKLQFSKNIYWLCVAVYLLCAAGTALSVWRIVKFGIHGFNDVIKYPFLIAVCLLCIVLVTAILIRSQYIVDDTHFITQYGLIKSKFVIKDVTSVTLDTDAKKLTVKFGEQYMVVSVSPEWNEKLVRALLAVNPNIDYGFTLSDKPEDTQEEK
ncbi:MAG: PH domain-containing protein [Clostridia bacterium]|nr:PH domain-containing protein [Clostridia bacterium]